MKKLVALFIALLMLFSTSCFASDDDKVYIEPKILDIFDYSVSEWTESYSSKVLFIAAATVDLLVTDKIESESNRVTSAISSAMSNDAIYVININNMGLNAAFIGEEEILMLTYVPFLDELTYSFLKTEGSISSNKLALVKGAKSSGMDSYSIDVSDFMEYLEMIADAIA